MRLLFLGPTEKELLFSILPISYLIHAQDLLYLKKIFILSKVFSDEGLEYGIRRNKIWFFKNTFIIFYAYISHYSFFCAFLIKFLRTIWLDQSVFRHRKEEGLRMTRSLSTNSTMKRTRRKGRSELANSLRRGSFPLSRYTFSFSERKHSLRMILLYNLLY